MLDCTVHEKIGVSSLGRINCFVTLWRGEQSCRIKSGEHVLPVICWKADRAATKTPQSSLAFNAVEDDVNESVLGLHIVNSVAMRTIHAPVFPVVISKPVSYEVKKCSLEEGEIEEYVISSPR